MIITEHGQETIDHITTNDKMINQYNLHTVRDCMRITILMTINQYAITVVVLVMYTEIALVENLITQMNR